jgi:glutamine synthetase
LFRLDLKTERRLREEGNIPYFIGEFVQDDRQSLHPICPRSRLKHVLSQAESMGFAASMAFEYEFFIFAETPRSVREKNYQNLVPLSEGNFGYSTLRTLVFSDLFNEFMDYCLVHDFALEGLHCETGPGVWEAAIAVDDCLRAADKAALFKTFAKAFFQKRGLIATFMAKWSMDFPGQSGHCHQSLWDLDGDNSAFHDASNDHGMSLIMQQYVAGQQKYMKPFLALTSPTINSYTRLVKGAWAPTASTWGVENRTAALRVIPGSARSQRVEFRVGSADANPYLVAAATLGAGLLGIRDKLSLGPAVTGNAYDIQDGLPDELQLPGNLRDSTRHLAASGEAREILGETFVDHYIASRDWEVREYERNVNDWQLRRYFELI